MCGYYTGYWRRLWKFPARHLHINAFGDGTNPSLIRTHNYRLNDSVVYYFLMSSDTSQISHDILIYVMNFVNYFLYLFLFVYLQYKKKPLGPQTKP